MRTSITGGSGLARTKLGTDSSRLNQESELLEFGNCLHRMAVMYFMDTTLLMVLPTHQHCNNQLFMSGLTYTSCFASAPASSETMQLSQLSLSPSKQ